MYSHKLLIASCCLTLLMMQNSSSQESPGLGVPISQQDLAPWDISIETDGSGLPSGSGTASVGELVYQAQCIQCHGDKGSDGLYDRLVGGHGTLDQLNQVKTVGSFWPNATTAFDYIRRSMPFNTPQTLSNDQVYALTAYLLFLNGIIEETEVLDASSLARIEMPNADGFIMAYPAR
jgi:S-disulfanyl-L-cysteine oxidoreductase SoxD